MPFRSFRSTGATYDFERILSDAKAGSPDALGLIYRKFNPRLRRFLVWQVHREGDDLAADVWTAVAPKISEFSGDEQAFQRWLFTFGRRRLVDYVRRSERFEPVAIGDDNFPNSDDPEAEALARVYATEAAHLLIMHLTADQREVLMLRTYGGLTTAEIATATNHTESWVRVTQHRAITRLRRKFRSNIA